nr:SH2 domain-containing protein 1B isoform X3 [Oryctolagus cuniculus]
MDLSYYHGPLTKQDCETLLLQEGVDGNFLLRDSESIPGALCLCVSFKNFVYTYRIFREKHGYYKIKIPINDNSDAKSCFFKGQLHCGQRPAADDALGSNCRRDSKTGLSKPKGIDLKI